MTAQIELPSDGVITRTAFDNLPRPVRGWAWELHNGRLELVHMPVTYWHSRVIMMVLSYWLRLGHEVASEQYVADSGFVRGGTGRNNYVADGVVFAKGHRPKPSDTRHDATDIHVVIEAVSERSEENDATHKLDVYAQLGIQHYWIVRGDGGHDEVDGLITMYELRDGCYEVVDHRMVSRLAAE